VFGCGRRRDQPAAIRASVRVLPVLVDHGWQAEAAHIESPFQARLADPLGVHEAGLREAVVPLLETGHHTGDGGALAPEIDDRSGREDRHNRASTEIAYIIGHCRLLGSEAPE
jgi:hypothetical protein